MRRNLVALGLAVLMVTSLGVAAYAGGGNDDEPVNGPACLDIQQGALAYTWTQNGGDDPLPPPLDDPSDDDHQGVLSVEMTTGTSPDPLCNKAKYLLYVAGTRAHDAGTPLVGTRGTADDESSFVAFPTIKSQNFDNHSSGDDTADTVGGAQTVCVYATATVGNSTFDRAPDETHQATGSPCPVGTIFVDEEGSGGQAFH